ncbi:unnamed protein product [Candida verbasci]|uniref:Ubiquitin carboxyl-terminal hydrolase n=1 Tax=Candida verbasci TaxID=1227364 RepID=A0A9W4TUW4_9ASCO|nr:unnamed protein product [Candida verbasci]
MNSFIRYFIFILILLSIFIEIFKLSLFKSNKLIATLSTSLFILFSLYYISSSLISEKFKDYYNIPQIFNKIMNSRFINRSGINRFSSKNQSKETKFAIKNGGEIGGISNDGNTCFMNSVIQSLASSRELNKFINSYLYSEIEIDNGGEIIKMKSNQPKSELIFTNALKNLLDAVNGKYGIKGKEFSTKPLLNKMPNGPKQNFFSGYNQEDAQEFYQLVMNLLEKEFKTMNSSRLPTPEPEEKPRKFVDIREVKEVISGCKSLGKLGTVYVPATQVDSNLEDANNKLMPLELVTPVDGISAERIGCLTCGEVGGIRYSVSSGLSLNLPQNNNNYYSSFNLLQLLNEYISPESIEDVNCNRCGLIQTKTFIEDTLQELKSKDNNEKIIEQFENRLRLINEELVKPHITDEIFEKLTIKKQIKKSKKSKQIFMDRPPPLLCIHINRSVFDPRTYMIVKNPSNVSFPAKLNLSPYIVEPNDINMDARLPFRKQDEEEEEEDEEKDTSNDLFYNLKAVISHYGTHNYGHYICYRKLRGTWWRISDESVYVVREEEVLNGQGTFMLFYEYDDGYKEILMDVSDEEEEEEKEKEDEKEEDINQVNETTKEINRADSEESEPLPATEHQENLSNNEDDSISTHSIDFNIAEAQVHL